MRFDRHMARTPTLSSVRYYYKKSLGHRIRDLIGAVGNKFHFVKKYLFPNFIVVHYFYTIMLIIITSILMFPVRNEKYIDILFLSAGAATQGGLNTVDVNALTLYQQLIIYLSCLISTPIAIHGFLAFVRLYWFERHFDGIRDSSKRDFKMRRTKTILERQTTARSMSRDYNNARRRSSYSHFRKPSRHEDFQHKIFSGEMVNRDKVHQKYSVPAPAQVAEDDVQSSDLFSGHIDLENNEPSVIINDPRKSTETNNMNQSNVSPFNNHEQFTGRRNYEEINPADMFRSITFLQGQHPGDDDDENGPALVIGAPSIGSTSHISDESKRENFNGASHSKTLSNPSIISNSTQVIPDSRSINSVPKIDSDEFELKSSSEESTDLKSETLESDLVISDERNSVQAYRQPTLSPVRLTQSDNSNLLEVEETPTKHVTMMEDDAPKRNFTSPELDVMFAETKRPTIQFDIVEPPRKKRVASNQNIDSKYSIWNKPKKNVNRRFLNQLTKGKKLRKKIKKTLSTNSVELFHGNSKRHMHDDSEEDTVDHGDDYDADYETDNEDNKQNESPTQLLTNGLKKTVSEGEVRNSSDPFVKFSRSKTMDIPNSNDLDQLTQSPEFQKMVYKNWKMEHKKKNKKTAPWNRFEHERRNDYYSQQSHDSRSLQRSASSNNEGTGNIFRRAFTLQNDKSDHDDAASNLAPDEIGAYKLHFDPDHFLADPRHNMSRTMTTNYLSWTPTVGRNSAFTNLTSTQKNELGGVEYRSTKLLCWILLVYYIGFHIISFIFMVPWVLRDLKYRELTRADGVSPTWWGFFTAMSAFNDLGLTLTPDSMNSFDGAIYPLVVMIWFIIIGNTGFPILLRFIIWVMFHLSPDLSQTKESLGFLLDHPRRCFTLLFPSGATIWLLLTLVALNSTDVILFIIFDFGSSVVKHLSKGRRVLVGLFQGVSTRTAGFSVVDLSKLHPAIQVSYMLMMYVSVLPLAISIRRTNVYEEQSLGIYEPSEEEEEEEEEIEEQNEDNESNDSNDASSSSRQRRNNSKKHEKKKKSAKSFIGTHLRKQLSYDLWFLFTGLFIICICEGGKIQDMRRPEFNIFSILFEIVSAYGTVGLSLGYPNVNQSFSSQFTTLSKLVIIALLIRGKSRGLPYKLDRAIILPSNQLDDIDDIQNLRQRRHTTVSDYDMADPVTDYVRSKANTVWNGYQRVQHKVVPTNHPSHQNENLNYDFDLSNINKNKNGTTATTLPAHSNRYTHRRHSVQVQPDL